MEMSQMTELTEEQERKLKIIFAELENEDDTIDKYELRRGAQLSNLNPTMADIENALKESNLDGDSKLNFEQFKVLITASNVNKSIDDIQAELHHSFKVKMEAMGLEETDRITKEQFEEIMQAEGEDRLTYEELDEIFQDLNIDDDAETLMITKVVKLFTEKMEVDN